MSTRLKPLLLPQLVEDRKLEEEMQTIYGSEFDWVQYTTSSSSSDVTSPITPTFSSKGHIRISSSTSSLDLPPQLQEQHPSSPTAPLSKTNTLRQLPDVQEEDAIEHVHDEVDDDEETEPEDHFGLYSCLCDEPCQHVRTSSDEFIVSGDLGGEYHDIDYDMGFLSDDAVSVDTRNSQKKRSGSDSPFSGLTSRIGSRLPSLNRWRASSRPRGNPMLLATERSVESVVLSGGASSRSSSMSAAPRHLSHHDRTNEQSVLATPALSYYGSSDSIDHVTSPLEISLSQRERSSLERERAMNSTPLLPPLMTTSLGRSSYESTIQSPSVTHSSAATEVHSPRHSGFSRPSLSTKPSVSSFRLSPISNELPLPLPASLQECDEWSDRLGHANFTITPQPYQPETRDVEALRQLRTDWETARCNYTKHLVRTGENYGETSKIYGYTEEKWAETEKRWRSVYDELKEHILATTRSISTVSDSTSRSRSRGRERGRGRSGSGGASVGRPCPEEILAGLEWRRMEEGQPSAVPRMLDADGKFPSRGDEDIVGPMQRDEFMVRTHSEDRKGARFWKNLVDKVSLRK